MTDDIEKPKSQKDIESILKEGTGPKLGAGLTGRTHFRTLRDGTQIGESRADNTLPERFGEWIVDEAFIGGAQAFVFRVHKEGVEGSFVLKLLKPWTEKSKQSSEREQRRRFIGEVSTLDTLRLTGCPRIVRVVDSRLDLESDEPLWYVMPLYEGGAMRRSGDDGEPGVFAEDYAGAIDRVLSIGADLAETVAVMHNGSPQIVHRDIHTQNIFFEVRGGPPILGDFGLAAKGKSPSEKGTALEETFGPWRWRPPEIRPGSNLKRETGSDVYMIGGVLYEALTGGRYIEETQDIENKFTHEKDDYRLSNYSDDPRVPLIGEMLRRCFVRNPDIRFSAYELRDACDAILRWRVGELPPDFGSRQIRMADAARRASSVSRVSWAMEQRDDLNKQLRAIREEIVALRDDVGRNKMAFEFSTELRLNSYPRPVERGYEELSGSKVSESPVACLLILVGFQPEPKVEISVSALIWRDEKKEYVAVAGEQLTPEIKSTSFHGDPNHAALIRDIAMAEIDRLQELATSAVEKFVADAAS